MNIKLDLEQKTVLTDGNAENHSPKGWMWCCDSQGRYLECSPEVSECLGISASDFIGMPVAWFGLTLSSAEFLQEALHEEQFPTRLELIFQTNEGNEVPVSFYIMGKAMLNGNNVLRGFVQILDQPDLQNPDSTNAGSQMTMANTDDVAAPQTERYQHASQYLLSILDELHKDIEYIRSAPNSRVIKKSDLQVVEDQTRPPRVNGILYEKKLVSYPERIVLQDIYRLEWGKKLDLSQAEENFLEKNQTSATGFAGKVQRRFTPSRLLAYDKFWIAIELAVVKNSSDSLSIIYNVQDGKPASENHGQPSRGLTTTLAAFLADPEPVKDELRKAINHPVHSRQVLQRGRDYLV